MSFHEKSMKNMREEKKDDDKGGFLNKVKGFIHDIGDKIEDTIGFGKPTADVTDIHISHITLKKADIVVDVLINNPTPFPSPSSTSTTSSRATTVKIPVCLVYDDIKTMYADIQPGSIIPYRVKVDLIVDVPVFGRLTLPLEKTGEIPIPYKPEVDIEKIRFDKFSFEETVATLHLRLNNKNDFDLGLNDLDYEIWLCDVSIGGAKLAKSARLEKNGVTSIDVPITFRPKDCGSALWDMIRGRGTGYTMKGNINVDTPFGAMKLPISKEGGTTRLRKNKEDDNDEVCM
ncbi:hypothetical protein CASFOL_034774 [Castilleja foliolosa]|uniref:Water stress and hypersensitive response domain-containing protein n=1 Tax=Castilleja foliolosa TaxID=1961234 RepID=A0ABD3BT38_9LAMI